MISEKLAREICREALNVSPANETMVLITGGKSALTRFANNHIHQNVQQKDYRVTVVTAFGKQVGVASSNLFDRGELERIVDVASTVAKRQKEDPMWAPLAGQFSYEAPKDCYDRSTIDKPAEAKAEMVRLIVNPCKEAGCKAAGALTNADKLVCVANSHGLFAYHSWTEADITLTVETESGASGWAEACSGRIDNINVEHLGKRAIEKAVAAENPVDISPGKYDVILEPTTTGTLLRYLAFAGLGGLAFIEGRSFISDRLEQKVMGGNITIRDDYMHGDRPGVPFDFEGFPRKRITLIENGVARNVVHSRRTADKSGRENTGHAMPYPSSYGPVPVNLVLEPGEISRQKQLASLKEGLLISRSWYESIVDPKIPSLTGMSRDGTFLVKNGEIIGAVKNIRYNEDLRDLFSRVESISSETETTVDWGAVVTAPAILVRDFNVTGSTK